jgi:hypothetical protein
MPFSLAEARMGFLFAGKKPSALNYAAKPRKSGLAMKAAPILRAASPMMEIIPKPRRAGIMRNDITKAKKISRRLAFKAQADSSNRQHQRTSLRSPEIFKAIRREAESVLRLPDFAANAGCPLEASFISRLAQETWEACNRAQ